jgi:hypothetical protein
MSEGRHEMPQRDSLFDHVRRFRAWVERVISPGLGTCYRCRRPWHFPATRTRWSDNDQWWTNYRLPRRNTHRVQYQLRRTRFFGLVGVEPHSTPYKDEHSPGSGCFPLCEGCWAVLTPSQRMPYYHALVNEWVRQLPDHRDEYEANRELIRKAVMSGV